MTEQMLSGWIDRWVGRWIDGWVDGWMGKCKAGWLAG